MSLYLLLILPALIAALSNERISGLKLAALWGATSMLMIWLVPIGSRDFENYLRDFSDFNQLSLAEAFGPEPIYTTAVWVFGHLGGSATTFYLFLGIVGLWIKLTALRRLSHESSVVVLAYMCSYFFLHDFTQVRAGVAIGIWMHALSDLEHSRRRYLVLTTIASLIHLQAVLGFLLLGIFALFRGAVGRWILSGGALVTIAIAATPYFDLLSYELIALIPDARASIYLQLASQEVAERPNPYNVISMLALITALSGLLLKQRADSEGATATQMPSQAVFVALLLGTCALAILSSVPVAALRVSEHFFALLPVGIWMGLCRDGKVPRYTFLLWLFSALFAYIFLFYSPYLLNPDADE